MINTDAIELNRGVGLGTIQLAEAMKKGWAEVKALGFSVDPNLERKPITRFMVNSKTMKISAYPEPRGAALPLWKIKANSRKRTLALLGGAALPLWKIKANSRKRTLALLGFDLALKR